MLLSDVAIVDVDVLNFAMEAIAHVEESVRHRGRDVLTNFALTMYLPNLSFTSGPRVVLVDVGERN